MKARKEMLRCWFKRTERIVKLLVLRTKGDIFHISYFLFNYKARDNTNKKSQFTM